ncbi:MarR family winged helix-turn-helix transcriptional regulator [Aliikangiella coralliicola]|uniref:MarR family transcriptional regulator n=1 Tax=Aliikangiella coralliicola TaxID=2592383 RepID=A0A545UGP6_9GAMM|nr:SMC-Scp complex subunit ScpB [Aliikangiella coralliicola]TQV88646.1 MarR family transcriptional regulator [Aliikangiella coralliicola]
MSIETKLLRLNRYLNMTAQNAEISAARFDVLRIIQEKNPVTLRQLCDIQGVSMPTMSKLVDELQKDNLVIRAQSKDDGRQRWIVPTQKGLQIFAEAALASKEKWEKKLGDLSKEQQQTLLESLDLLLERLSTS